MKKLDRKELPIIELSGTPFEIDVSKLVLREKANPQNTISLFDMYDHGDGSGYSFEYSLANKNIPTNYNDKNTISILIPELVKLDPLGMSAKYGGKITESTTDFDLMVDQEAWNKRVNLGQLPTVDIAGHTFYADARIDQLRPKDDFSTVGIIFSEIDHYFDEVKGSYLIPYNPKKHEFQELDYDKITSYPKDLIAVQFPGERTLDPIGYNRRHDFELKGNLKEVGLKLQHKAEIVPWEKTGLKKIIGRNLMSGAIEEIDNVMRAKGYQYFNIYNGANGVNLKDGLTSYLRDYPDGGIPVRVVTSIAATDPSKPYSSATLQLGSDTKKGLKVISMHISMYECYDGVLRTTLEVKPKSFNDLPTQEQAKKMIESHWQKIKMENSQKNKLQRQIRPKGRRKL